MDACYHRPVLFEEAMESLAIREGGRYLDGTVGGGGHAEEIARRMGPSGFLIALDVDDDAIAAARRRLEPLDRRIIVRKCNFIDMREIAASCGFSSLDGILLDLGVSSHQLETTERGFSFLRDAPLDMRMDAGSVRTAADIVNDWSAEDLLRIIREYGEEPRAKSIVRAIVRRRKESPIATTGDIAAIIALAVGKGRDRGKIHPATKTFQALRIALNDEMNNLEKALEEAIELLAPGGRISIISFHSLEDRAVKRAFRSWEGRCTCPPSFPMCTCGRKRRAKVITRRPVTAGDEERRENPRARSAKLRTAEKV